MTKKITKQAARLYLLGQLLLKSNVLPTGKEGFVKLLNTLRHIQIDPLTQIGRSHELVALARVDGLKLDSFHELMGGTHGFEHWAKERCLLPAYALPYYLNYEYAQSSWFSLEKRKSCLSEEVLDSVLQEIEKRGPIESSKLEDRGKVKHNAEWIKTKDDQRDANKIAVEALWLMCKIVIVGRNSKNQKIYHVTKKIFPDIKKKNITEKEFVIWALKERIEAAGFLSRAASIAWSALGKYRTSEIIDELIKDGQIEEVVIEGSRAKYLAPKDFDKRQFPDFDDRLRIIAPLDPVIWDKKLVQFLFDFKYGWEVYKPKSKRQYGYYVCPLLYKGKFVARMEAKLEDEQLKIKNIWLENGIKFKDIEEPFNQAMKRHAKACSVTKFMIENIHESNTEKKRKIDTKSKSKKRKRKLFVH